MTKQTDSLSFEVLDRLLDEALALEGQALEDFLSRLEESQKIALTKLLDKSGTDALGPIAATAQRIAKSLQERPGGRVKAGEWELKREIGSGGMGQVFYAERHEQTQTDGKNQDAFVQRAAVKVLWSHRVRSQFKERFLRERRILASIDHPGLARFLDGGLLGDGRPWFAMEFVDGKDIVSFCERLSINERLVLFVQIAETINFAHQRLVVHRDIKPQNILVDSFSKPRVLDFGIAGLLGELDEQSLTLDQGTPLTLQYASPEQLSDAAVDAASDVYQLGLLLFEMLTGEKPYRIDDQSLKNAVETIRRQAPTLASAHNAKVDKDLDVIIGKALRKNPIARYSSAAAMSDDVSRFLEGRPITARSQSRWYVFTRFVRRNALVAGVIAASFAVLSIATVFSLKSAAQAREEAQRSRVTQEILADVFEQADPFGDGGADLTLAEALVRAKPFIREQVAHDPRLEWEVNKTLVGIFTNLDLIDLEKEALQTAWDAAKKLDGDNERERLFAIAGLGNILVRTDPAQGVAFLDEHLPRSPRSARAASDWLSGKYAQVNAQLRLREDDKADQGTREMARVANEFGIKAPRTLGRIEQLLAGSARRSGDLDAADTHWSNAVMQMRRADAPLSLAITLSNQALHYGMTKRYEESAAVFRESIDIFERYEPENTSHANALRLYAGLLFRMGEADEAQAALDGALRILSPDEQAYAVFVAQLNRAKFAFATDDMATALNAVENGLQLALTAFGQESEVTRRMLPTLARALVLAGREVQAVALLLPADNRTCNNPLGLINELEAKLSGIDRSTQSQERNTFLAAIPQTAANVQDLTPATLTDAMTTYRNASDVFINALDRYRFLTALKAGVEEAGLSLSSDLRTELQRLHALSVETASIFDASPSLQAQIEVLSSGFLKRCSSF